MLIEYYIQKCFLLKIRKGIIKYTYLHIVNIHIIKYTYCKYTYC